MKDQSIFLPKDGSRRGIFVYDNGLYDGIDFDDSMLNWEVELSRKMPKAFIATEHESLYSASWKRGCSVPSLEVQDTSELGPIWVLRMVKYGSTRRCLISDICAQKYLDIFDSLNY